MTHVQFKHHHHPD
ncbi:hypothetical protein GYM22_003059 [Escherichia coli]|nr:hypothetical protein [Escherichia coli]EFO0929920.1 hypothetical protein [Escherichia coli O157]EFB3729621.1 hypothetical protein [Escherichia coli]EFE6296527.1 hypothetical protein [Escherichia coli]EFE8291885.1 hypothetical protein [Escherichia coli]